MGSAVTIALIVSALLTSILSSLVGMGGGVVLLGIMASLMPAKWVVPLHGVVQLASNITRSVVFLKHVRWSIFYYFAPAMILGIYWATQLWSGDNLSHYKPLIGVFILIYLLSRKFKPTWTNPPFAIYTVVGVLAGFVTMFIGATGPFLAPFFLRDDMEKESIIATKAICHSMGHLLKIPAFLSLGFNYGEHDKLLSVLVLMVIIGTILGKKALSLINHETFVQLFVGVLSLLAAWLLLSPLF